MSKTPTSAAQAERQAEQLRQQLAGTIEQLRDNLRPRRLAREALDTTRTHTPDWLLRAVDFVQSPMGIALIGTAAASVATTVYSRRQRRWS